VCGEVAEVAVVVGSRCVARGTSLGCGWPRVSAGEGGGGSLILRTWRPTLEAAGGARILGLCPVLLRFDFAPATFSILSMTKDGASRRHGVGGCSGRCASGTWLLLRYCCCASMPPMLRLLLLLLLAKETSALDNGLGLLPPQAWRSWNVRATLIRHDSNRWPARLLVPLVRHIRGSRSTARVRGNSRPIVSHGTHRCCSHAGIPRELQPVHDPRHDRRAGGQEPHGGREADEPQGSGLRHDRNR
jgi:hypothetical protein